jgi:hypothetical protein
VRATLTVSGEKTLKEKVTLGVDAIDVQGRPVVNGPWRVVVARILRSIYDERPGRSVARSLEVQLGDICCTDLL